MEERYISQRELDAVQKALNIAANFADIVNTTTDKEEFFIYLNKINEILNFLVRYEGVVKFHKLPSIMLKEISDDRSKSIDLLEKRIKESINTKDESLFHKACFSILKNYGFQILEQSGRGKEIDFVAFRKGDPFRYGIKCKTLSITEGSVRLTCLNAKVHNCHVPVVMTNDYFSDDIIDFAEKMNVALWDKDYIIDLIEKAKI